MQKWEYDVRFVYADINNKGAKDFLKQKYPNYKPARYSPHSMEPFLNDLGFSGWELVHMEPVARVGDNDDVEFQGDLSRWSSVYFCVFKRPVE